jgi:hypothetical protein
MVFILLLFTVIPLYPAFVVQGNDPTGTTSFTFKIDKHFYEQAVQQLYVGASEVVAGNAYALANSTNGGAFSPLVPATVTVDGVANSANPITGRSINHLAVANDSAQILPAVVTDNAPARVFAVPDNKNVYTTPVLNDAGGVASAGVIGLTGGGIHPSYAGHYFVAAVRASSGDFGTGNSGLALVLHNGSSLSALNANTGAVGGNRAITFNDSTPAVFITNPVTALQQQVDMTFDNKLQRFYVACPATADAGGSDGQRSVVAGRIVNNVMQLTAIAPDAAFIGTTNKIVGGGSGTTSFIYFVRTLQTSTRLPYLVVAGGVSSTEANVIYSVPLTSDGLLANNNATPTDEFRINYPYSFVSRSLPNAAVPDDLLSSTDTAAMVGAGPAPIPANFSVGDIIALNDAVYIAIQAEYDGTTTPVAQPGMFYSQAMFDAVGKIKGWTAWTRISGSDAKLQGLAVDPQQNRFWMIPYDGNIAGSQTVKLTQWGQNFGDGLLGGNSGAPQNGLTSQIVTQLPSDQGIVQGMFSFARTTTGFGNRPDIANNQIGVLAYVSRNKLMLVESGLNAEAGKFKPTSGDFATGQQIFTNGTLTGYVTGSTMLVISGGVLDAIGPLTSVEVSRAPLTGGNNGFFFVGGSAGLAVLSETNGAGWSTAVGAGLKAGFVGLTSTMSFRTLGNYQNVRKLVADGTYLYVLTNSTLDRITLSSIAAGGALTVVNLANVSALNLPSFASFSDAAVSGRLALLATSGGLFRAGNGTDVKAAGNSNPDSMLWTRVSLPENFGPVTRLQFITPTNLETDFALGSLMYVLCGATPYNQARVYRLSINEAVTSAITNNTVQNLNDLFIRGVPSYLIEYGSYRNYSQSDSVALFNTKAGNELTTGAQLLNYGMYTMADIYAAQKNTLVSQLPFTVGGTVRRPVRNDSSGAWMIAGDSGLFVNE